MDRNKIKMVVMDVDGTLTDGKYIWEKMEKFLRLSMPKTV